MWIKRNPPKVETVRSTRAKRSKVIIMAKKKLSDETKVKLFYSGELFLIGLVFAIIAILVLIGVIKRSDTKNLVFNWITIFGGTWLIVDFFWGLCSKSRRKRICLLDKILHLPLGIYLVTFDLICFIAKPDIYSWGVPVAFLYVALSYTFEAIYHWFKPLPQILEAIEEDKKEEESKNKPEE